MDVTLEAGAHSSANPALDAALAGITALDAVRDGGS
jgi:hypothetical protein